MYEHILKGLGLAYLCMLLAGFMTGKVTAIKVSSLKKISNHLYDPFTVRLKMLWHKHFESYINHARFWPLLFTIFLNNLVLAAFVSRILYGVLFFYPALLTLWSGFAKGVVFSRVPAFNPFLLLEFVAYLLAASLGVYLGLSGLIYLLSGAGDEFYRALETFAILFPILALILLVHSVIESRMIIRAHKLAGGMEFNMEEARQEMLARLDRQDNSNRKETK